MASESDAGGRVPHPRFGSEPRISGLDAKDGAPGVFLHWHSGRSRFPGTAIPADLSRQTPATFPVTHYYDYEEVCRGCNRPFIFFAEEQKFWFEDLRLPLEAQPVRCVPCRAEERALIRAKERYDSLLKKEERSTEENLDIVSAALMLIENGVFSRNMTDRLRAVLKKLPADGATDALWKRLKDVEAA